ncbi:MAG: hypothetical protein ABJL18_11255 [Hyphomicrobiales bacterium]
MFKFLKAEPSKRKTTVEIRKEIEARNDAIGSNIAARFTRGNTSIQQGAFLMDEDLLQSQKR